MAFPFSATYTGLATCCGASLPVGLQSWTLRGVGPIGPYFRAGVPGAPWGARVTRVGANWEWVETSGVFLFGGAMVLVYSAVTRKFTWSGNLQCACFPFANVAVSVQWDPTIIASAAIQRNVVDEIVPATGELLRWSLPLEELAGSLAVSSVMTTAAWTRDRAVGDFYKWNTRSEDRAAGQSLTWLF